MLKAKKLVKAMVKRAIALGGTCTGEHGVGIGKREYLYEELGFGTVELMKRIKRSIDPLNLFNPGKVSRRSPCLVNLFFVLNPCRCTQIRQHKTLRGARHDYQRHPHRRPFLIDADSSCICNGSGALAVVGGVT